MQTNANAKIETYLGFSIRAGKATFGLDRTEELRRAPALIMVDESFSPGSKGRALRLAERFRCPFILCKGVSLGTLLHRPACKLVAVSEKNLAAAILAAAENNGDFTILKEVRIGGNI